MMINSNQILCHRLVACLFVMHRPKYCTVQPRSYEDPLAPYVVLEILRQLSSEACRLVSELFNSLNTFLRRTRPKSRPHFRESLSMIASGLGQVHEALKTFGAERNDRFNFVSWLTR